MDELRIYGFGLLQDDLSERLEGYFIKNQISFEKRGSCYHLFICHMRGYSHRSFVEAQEFVVRFGRVKLSVAEKEGMVLCMGLSASWGISLSCSGESETHRRMIYELLANLSQCVGGYVVIDESQFGTMFSEGKGEYPGQCYEVAYESSEGELSYFCLVDSSRFRYMIQEPVRGVVKTELSEYTRRAAGLDYT